MDGSHETASGADGCGMGTFDHGPTPSARILYEGVKKKQQGGGGVTITVLGYV